MNARAVTQVFQMRAGDGDGKTATRISGGPLDEDALRELAGGLKRQCGTGGSVKDGVIVIVVGYNAGDQCGVVIPLLQKRGYTVKRTGG